jgi:hypothetical protein
MKRDFGNIMLNKIIVSLILITFITLGDFRSSWAQEIKLLNTADTCNGAATGAIRYNNGTTTFEECNGSAWAALGATASGWTKSGQNVYSSVTGNVGVGTTVPVETLDVRGAMRIIGSGVTAGMSAVISTSLVSGGIEISSMTDSGNNQTYNAEAGRYIIGPRGHYFQSSARVTPRVWTTRLLVGNGFESTSGDIGIGGAITSTQTLAGSSMVVKSGNVGIGTITPLASMQVGVGTNTVVNAPTLGTNDALITGNLVVDGKIYGDGSQLTGISSSQWTTTGNNIYYNTGNVGIGVISPTSKLSVVSSLTAGHGVAFNVTQTAVNTIDSGDMALVLGHTLSAVSASNQLVVRSMFLGVNNNLTGGGVISNMRAFNLSASTQTGTTTDALDLIYLENETVNGTVTVSRGIHVTPLQGTSRAAFVSAIGTGGTNNSDIVLGTSAVPVGNYAIYSASSSKSYFAGNVGIGTTSSVQMLDVRGSQYVSGNVGIGSVSPAAKLDIKGAGTTSATSSMIIRKSTGAANMTVLDNGNVGIGTWVPQGKLHVTGGEVGILSSYSPDISLDADLFTYMSNPRVVLYNGDMLDAFIAIGYDGVRQNYFGTGEISSTSANTALGNGSSILEWNFYGADGADYSRGAQMNVVVDGAVSSGNVPTAVSFLTGSNDSNVTERIRISSSGNVGIGSSAPQALLDVGGLVRLRGAMGGTGLYVDAGGNVGIGTATPMSKLSIFDTTIGDGFVVVNPNSGLNSVGDGTSELQFGQVTSGGHFSAISLAGDGIVRTVGSPANGNLILQASNTTGAIKFVTGGVNVETLKMIITNGGNVGIGTTVPDGKLEVAGQYFSRRYTATTSINWVNGNTQFVQLVNGANSISLTGAKPGGRYLLELKQPASGVAGTVTWADANVKWSAATAPTLTATNGRTDIVTFYYNGTNYAGAASLDYAL